MVLMFAVVAVVLTSGPVGERRGPAAYSTTTTNRPRFSGHRRMTGLRALA